jgi:hypothetical protein
VEFIEVRRKALDMFLNRVAAHPELRKSKDLKNFLQVDEEVWASLQCWNVKQPSAGDSVRLPDPMVDLVTY